MLDVPAPMPARLTCDTCGFMADVAVVADDTHGETLAVSCWRDRIDLPRRLPPGTMRIERRYGRWYREQIAVETLFGTGLDLTVRPAAHLPQWSPSNARTTRAGRPLRVAGAARC